LLLGLLMALARIPNTGRCALLSNAGFDGSLITFVDTERQTSITINNRLSAEYSVDENANRLLFIEHGKTGQPSKIHMGQFELETGSIKCDSLRFIQTVANGVENPSDWRFSKPDLWLKNSRAVLLLWQSTGEQAYLTFADGTPDALRTTPFTRLDRVRVDNNAAPDALSPDEQFFTISEQAGRKTSNIRIFSLDTLTQVNTSPVFTTGAWSPSASIYAGVSIEADEPILKIWSKSGVTTRALSTTFDRKYETVLWSPNGHFFALQSHRLCQADEPCVERRLVFDIFDWHGTSIVEGLLGRADSEYGTVDFLNQARWSANSQNFVFLQGRLSQTSTFVIDIVGFQPETLQQLIYARDTTTTTADDVFFQQIYYSSNGLHSRLENRQTLLAVAQLGDHIRAQLIDMNSGVATPILDAVGSFQEIQSDFVGGVHLWTFDGASVFIPWYKSKPDGTRQLSLTWASVQGTEIGQADLPGDNIKAIRTFFGSSDPRIRDLLSYTVRVGPLSSYTYSSGLVSRKTGVVYPILNGLSNQSQFWFSSIAPDAKHGVLTAMDSTHPRVNATYLIDFDTITARNLEHNTLGGVWHDNGTYMYLATDTNQGSLRFVFTSIDGQISRSFPVNVAGQDKMSLIGINNCSPPIY